MRKVRAVVARTPEELAETLGLPEASSEWRLQAALLKRLRGVVVKDGLSHAEIARRSGTSRTRVTAILNGHLEHVSSDLLVRILAGLGYRVRVSLVRSPVAA
jgi:predicted XRE-type DNA-binding protein